jgi:purine-cytosine permease-like protein
MNKKGTSPTPIQLVLGFGLLIVILIGLFGGGLSAILNLFKFISKVPAWVWIILIILFLFGGRGGKRRR